MRTKARRLPILLETTHPLFVMHSDLVCSKVLTLVRVVKRGAREFRLRAGAVHLQDEEAN